MSTGCQPGVGSAPKKLGSLEIKIDMTLRGDLAERFVIEAGRRGRTPSDVMADLIEAIVKDDLFAAVLDP